MKPAPIPKDDDKRVESLHKLGLLDTPPEERFDRITETVKRVFDVPIALVSLVDANRQWFKSCNGLDTKEFDRDVSFCGHAILSDDPFIIPDATKDERFFDNPLVTGSENIVFYAGVPLSAPDGENIGTLCVIDHEARDLDEEQIELLKNLASWAELEINSKNLNFLKEEKEKSQKKLNKIISNIPVMIAYYNSDKKLKFVNKEFESKLGWDMDELKKEKYQNKIYPDTETQKKALNFMTETNTDWREFTLQTKNQEKIDTDWYITHAKGGDYIAIGRDITKEKKKKRDLKRNSDQFKLLINVASILQNIELEKNKKFDKILKKVRSQFGVSRAYIFEDNPSQNTTTNVAEVTDGSVTSQKENLVDISYQEIPSFKELLDSNEIIRESNIKNLPQDIYEILEPQDIKSILVVPVRNKKETFGFIGFDQCDRFREWSHIDVKNIQILSNLLSSFYNADSYRKQIKIREEKTKNILRGTNVGTWEWNVKTGETEFNERWAEIIGYKLSELEPTTIETWEKFTHPDDLEKSEEKLKKHFAGKTDFYECRARMKHKKGHWVWVLDRGKVFDWTEEGEPLLVYGTHQDITEQMRINKSKDEFISLASHQLRTPLTNINWYSEVLMEADYGKITDKQKEFLEEIEKGVEEMNDLIDMLLNTSRVDSGSFEVENEDINLIKLLKDIVKEFENSINKKNIDFDLECEYEAKKITADKNLLKIILNNLVSNAVKYTQSESKFGINASQVNENYIQIEVWDRGYGIPAKDQENIFRKMFRADNVKEKDTKGTGLGLYMVKSILNSTGGSIKFESSEGEGTTFYVQIPIEGMQEQEGGKSLVLG